MLYDTINELNYQYYEFLVELYKNNKRLDDFVDFFKELDEPGRLFVLSKAFDEKISEDANDRLADEGYIYWLIDTLIQKINYNTFLINHIMIKISDADSVNLLYNAKDYSERIFKYSTLLSKECDRLLQLQKKD